MSVEAQARGGPSLAEVAGLGLQEIRGHLAETANALQDRVSRLFRYNTPDGKPLEFHTYEPGEKRIFNREQTLRIKQIVEGS